MVKLKLTILFSVFILAVSAQEKVDKYYCANLGQSFNIRASTNPDNKPILYLEVFSGILKDRYYFKFDKNHSAFIEALLKAKAKFTEWKKTVKENDVSYTIKEMDVAFPIVEVWMYDSFEKKFTYLETLNLRPIFSVLGNKECRLQLSASSELLSETAYSIVLVKEREFDKLASKVSAENLLLKLAKAK
ncbi:MAG: hypothetical protein R2800_09485 [Flavipsychrobacter sp.]